MDGNGRRLDLAPLVDDRLEDGVFRVDRSIYLDPAIYEAEIDLFFERGWVFLCHESQIPKAGDYFATWIGRQPVFAVRKPDGGFAAFINACAHRGAVLTPYQCGNAKAFTCRFHGWTYGLDGRCIKIKNEETGFPGPGFDRSKYNLTAVPQVEHYRGFVFGCLDAHAAPLGDHLGDTRPFIDLFADQSPAGIEVLPGAQTYVCDHNWKLQAENVTDGYHVSTVHRNFMTTVLHREERDGTSGLLKTEVGRIQGGVMNGQYDLGRGHNALWADRSSPEAAPIAPLAAEVAARVPPGRAKWMLKRGRNLLVFPNMVLNDLASTHMRTHRPLAVDKTEVTIWCVAPKGESKEARYARLRKFEDFFLATGMSTSDDIVSLDTAHAGYFARHARWSDMTRGLAGLRPGPDDAARELGIDPPYHGASWDHEGIYVGFYRYWRDALMRGEV
ncbi:MAG: Rieske 2Fe-2S domain-containing protein [Rhodospirillaceae bacterium]